MQKERRATGILQCCEIFVGCVCCVDCFLNVFFMAFYQNSLNVTSVLSYFYVISLTLSTI